MNILVTVDSNYIRPLKIMLTSFFDYHKAENKIYLFYNNVKQSELEEVDKLVKEHGSVFVPIKMEEDLFSGVPVFRYFTKEMYYRILAAKILPQEKRVLYLDPDILIRGSIEHIYEIDLEGNLLAGVEDYAIKTLLSAHKADLGFSPEEQYINSGVLLMDLEAIRETFHEEDIYQIIEETGEFLHYPDQDIINLLFRGKIKILDRCYNYNTGYGSDKEMLKYMLGGFIKEKKYPVVVHYMGATKPWNPKYCGKFGKEYRKYFKVYLDPNVDTEWKKRHLLVLKHILGAVAYKIGGKKR